MELEQQRCWLSLAQQPYPVISEFLKQISTENIEDEAGSLIDHWLKKHHCNVDKSSLDKVQQWLEAPDCQIMAFPQYPEGLKAIKDPPVILFLEGNSELLFRPILAIVGSRKATSGARENASYFSRVLAESGLTIMSGLAMGIDGIAHQSALDVGGTTAAVLGCGHNTCYPAKHQRLFQEIKTKGLLISEFMPDTPVRPYQFPRRNRIISGLSSGVLVVEATIKSGSLITCRLAAEQGRDVFAIPGDITNLMSRGCHHLIRQGACLVDNPQQIIDELGIEIEPINCAPDVKTAISNNTYSGCSKDENKLMNCINRHPTSLDSLINRSGMKMELVLSVLFSLELKDKIVGSADGYFKK